MNVAPLVVTTREPAIGRRTAGGMVENVHHGSIAVVTVDGRLSHSVGDPDYPTFTRSTLKPLQALAFVREGGADRLGWGPREIALMCASHSGEAIHTGIVAAMLAAIGCDVSDLQCGCQVPGWYAALGQKPSDGARFTPLEHNCSGKHAGFLAACRHHHEPVAAYLDPDAPVQRRIAAAVGEVAGLDPDRLVTATDGCSAPNHAMPLSRLALAYARLAQGEGDGLGLLFDAMTAHPDLVSGTARSDLALMSHGKGDWVTKIGADGVQAIGIRSLGIGIAIKVADGHRDALYCAVIETLVQLGLFGPDDAVPESVAHWRAPEIRNNRSIVTGRMQSGFELRCG